MNVVIACRRSVALLCVLCLCGTLAGCLAKVPRACKDDTQCLDLAPLRFCLKGFCSDRACDPGAQEACYSGPPATRDVGICSSGLKLCQADGLWSTCLNEQTPQNEICDRDDNDCDGKADNVSEGSCVCDQVGARRNCYAGPKGTDGVSECKAGLQYCERDNRWGRCLGQVGPTKEVCDGRDNDCDGVIDDNTCRCVDGVRRPCYSGPSRSLGVGTCLAGVQTCKGTTWGVCEGQRLPELQDDCAKKQDTNCDGTIDESCDQVCAVATPTRCGSDCVDTLADAKHCGGCDAPCATDATCAKGKCQCAADKPIVCGGKCVALRAEGKPCDDCKDACALGLSCQNKVCVRGCQPGLTLCGTPAACTDLKQHPLHCGGCNKKCAEGQRCNAGVCECPTGQTVCDQPGGKGPACVSLAFDPGHCGKCGGVCPAGRPCANSQCLNKCPTDQKECSGACCPSGYSCCNNACKAPNSLDLCNGLDDDCDGKTDEDFPNKGMACTTGTPLCPLKGVQECESNGLSLKCVPLGNPTKETSCDGKDDDCNGLIDDALTQQCTLGNGLVICAGALETCTNGKWGGCDAPGYETVETSCDGLDNDCDGQVDEDIKGPLCSSQVSVCKGSQKRCVNGAFAVCSAADYGPSYEVIETRCDGLDNDCDGKVDDGADCKLLPLAATLPLITIGTGGVDVTIHALAFHPNGRFFFSGAAYQSTLGNEQDLVLMWDANTRQILTRFTDPTNGHKGTVESLAVSPDGKHLATGTTTQTNRSVNLWDIGSGQLRYTFTGPAANNLRYFGELTFSPDSKWLVGAVGRRTSSLGPGKPGEIYVWEVATGKVLQTFAGHDGGTTSIAFHPGGQDMVSVGYDKSIKVWSLRAFDAASKVATKVFPGVAEILYNVTFSPTGDKFVVTGDKGIIQLWNWAPPAFTAKPISLGQEGTGRVDQALFHPSGDVLLTMINAPISAPNGPRLTAWDLTLAAPVPFHVRNEYDFGLYSMALSLDGSKLITGGRRGKIMLRKRPRSCKKPYFFTDPTVGHPQKHSGTIFSVTFAPASRYVVTAGDDKVALVWDFARRSLIQRLPVNGTTFAPSHGATVSGVVVSPHALFSDAPFVATCSGDGNVILTNTGTGTLFKELDVSAQTAPCFGIAFHPAFPTVAVASGKAVRLFPYTTAPGTKFLAPTSMVPVVSTGRVLSVAISPDGVEVAAGFNDGYLEVWRHADQKSLFTKKLATFPKALAYSPDGKSLAIADGKNVVLFPRGSIVPTFTKLMADNVNSIAWSPDGKRIFIGLENADLVVMEADGQSFVTLATTHTSAVYGVAWSPDGEYLASVDEGGKTHVWRCP